MCRYAFHTYKSHFACFRCRKMFRRPPDSELARPQHLTPVERGTATCPQCGEPMHDLGLDFRAPKQSDVKQWQKVQILFQHGFTFHSCGCGCGLRPAELRDVETFLADQLPRSEGEKLLQKIGRAVAAKQNRQRITNTAGRDHSQAADAARLKEPGEAAAVAASLFR